MNIMLTGATGNLGHHITSQAIEHGIGRFYIGVRNLEKVPEQWRDNVSVRQLDYFDEKVWLQHFKRLIRSFYTKYHTSIY